MLQNLPSVGVIGVGFVGRAIVHAFEHYTSVHAFDINRKRSVSTFGEAATQEVVFLCLPTPMQSDGGGRY